MLGIRRSTTGRLATLLICALFAAAQGAGAELYPIRVYRHQDGLAHQNVRSILQDARGFLWLGTANGLSRFDGALFVNYGREHGLPGAPIHDLLELEPGVLLLATDLGLFRFDARATVPRAEPSSLDAGSTGAVFRLCRDSSGGIWAGAERGLFHIEDEDGAGPFRAERRSGTTVRALLADRDGSLWIGSASGLFRRTPAGNVESLGIGGRVRALAEDREGRIWIGLDPGLTVLLPATAASPESPPAGLPSRPGETRTFSAVDGFARSQVRVIHLAGDGGIWIGAVGALYELDGARLRRYGIEHGLSDLTINAIVEDRTGDRWLGSDLGGAMRWSREGLVTFTLADGLGHDTVDSVIGAGSELFAFNGERAVLSRRVGERLFSFQLPLPDDVLELVLREPPTKAMRDARGQWWITTTAGLLRFEGIDELAAGRPLAWYRAGDGLASEHIHRAFEDRRGDLWILAFGRVRGTVTRWRWGDETFERFTTRDGLPEAGYPTAFAEVSGLPILGWSTGALVRYRAPRFEVFGLTEGKAVNELRVDRAGRLWVATAGEGLLLFPDPSSESPVWARAGAALPRDCRTLAEDRWGRIYAGTVAGVFRLDPGTERVEALVAADGSAATEITAAHTDEQGVLWFGSYGGLARLMPRPARAISPATVWIGGVGIDGVPYPVSGLGESGVGPFDLSDHRSVIRFDYFGLSFDSRREPRFQFRLEGVDQDWGPPTRQQSVLYANLAPGAYRFAVRRALAEGSRPAVVSFRIPPPFWQSAWFLGLLLLAGSLLLLLAHRVRLRQLLAVERVRTRIAADLHDDIGASLSRISLLSEVARQGAPGDRDDSLGRIGEIARDLSSRTRDIVWSLNPRFDDLASFAVRLREIAGQLLDERGVRWQLEASGARHRIRLHPEQRRHLILVFKEALHNVAKHSRARRVELSLRVAGRRLSGEVRDDGRGFEPGEVEHSGSGLANVETRIAQLGGSVVLSSAPGEGTRLSFEVPLRPA